MKKFITNRYNILFLIFALLICVLGYRLAVLTLVEGSNYREIADVKKIKDIPIKAPRGKIFDRNGVVLADNISSFTVQMYVDQINEEEFNQISYTLAKILDENAENPIDEFPILLDTFEYKVRKISKDVHYEKSANDEIIDLVKDNLYEWINYEAEIYGEKYNPKDLILKLIKKDVEDFNIELFDGQLAFNNDNEHKEVAESTDVKNQNPSEVIVEKLLTENKYIKELFSNSKIRKFSYEFLNSKGLVNDIELKEFSFSYNKEIWIRNNVSLDENLSDYTAEEVFNIMRNSLEVDSNINNYDLRNMLVIRERYNKTSYLSYHPVDIAYGVTEKSVSMISERSHELKGIGVEIEPLRSYPEKESAAHILGYLGKISQENEIKEYIVENSYSPDDIIGKTGVEEKFEHYLRGEKGKKTVEVNNVGETIKSVSSQIPVPGDDLYLTIDVNLQRKAEESLKKGLEQIQKGGVFESEWGNFKFGDSYVNATSGSLVALDVKTGEILAMVNYPSYDLNMFSTGISAENWKSLQNESRNPLAPKPLYNIAMLTSIQPGSTFKMVTALAALEKGVDPQTEIFCPGTIKVGERNFNCWTYTLYGYGHGWQNMYDAIQNSCNIYFFVTMLGVNPATEQRHTVRVDADDIIETAKKLGLDSKTGIEVDIPQEASGGVPSIDGKKSSIRVYLSIFLESKLEHYLKDEIKLDEGMKNKIIEEIVSWVDIEETMTRKEVFDGLNSLGLNPDKTNDSNVPLVDIIKYSYINQALWTAGDNLNMAIGQGSNSYTVLQMANYVATIANGGYKRNVSVIKDIKTYDGRKTDYVLVRESERIELEDYSHLEILKEGMRRVSLNDSAEPYKDFPVEVGSKTGTAQKEGINPETNEPYDEFAWYVAFAPYDDPQIAVAVVLFQGGSGRYPTPIAREVIGEYLKIKGIN